jgi:general L-amino acid transport system permease protein
VRTTVWRSARYRRAFVQVLFVAVVAGTLYYLWFNLVTNMGRIGQSLDFSFLKESAGFRIAGTDFRSSDTVLESLLVGVKNTLMVSGAGIVLAMILGLVIGIARLSTNWLVAKAAAVYVETIRNIPLLVIIFFWSAAVILKLPRIADASTLGPFSLSNRGLVMPWFGGDITVRPDFAALLAGLVVYTASHIAEIVRGSVQAVQRGQDEAAQALALSGFQRMWFVVLPQAFRIALPQLANQFLNLTKNSSLGIAVAYAELMTIAQINIANRAPAPQAIAILMAFYLAMSLTIAGITNLMNKRLGRFVA